MSQNIILTHEEIEHKTQRIAYQIYETFGDDEELIIAGISKNGFILAENILKKISKIMATKITICEVFIDKQNPLNPVTTSIPKEI